MKCPVMVTDGKAKIEYQSIKGEDIKKIGKKGEIILKDGSCRLPNISHLRRVILSKDGFKVEKIEQNPYFVGKTNDGDYGVEDPRITKIGKKYYMTYVGVSQFQGVSTYLAVSNDLKKWKRLGLIFREQNKDAVLFPEKINGEYVALNRPESTLHFTKPSIWISYSKDLIYWGKDKNLMRPREKSWESERIGGGPPPLKTKKGWLIIYHGLKSGKKSSYSAGAALLDLKNPEKIIARSPINKPLIKPIQKHEKKGFINNVVFPTGLVPDLDGKHLLIYSGAADSYTTVKKIAIKDIFKNMEPVKN